MSQLKSTWVALGLTPHPSHRRADWYLQRKRARTPVPQRWDHLGPPNPAVVAMLFAQCSPQSTHALFSCITVSCSLILPWFSNSSLVITPSLRSKSHRGKPLPSFVPTSSEPHICLPLTCTIGLPVFSRVPSGHTKSCPLVSSQVGNYPSSPPSTISPSSWIIPTSTQTSWDTISY